MYATVARAAPSKVLVVGAGAIGLRTALELSRRDVQVVVRAPNHPVKESCSVIAGGLWMPFRCNDSRIDRWATQTLQELLDILKEKPNEGLVEIVPAIRLLRDNTGPTMDDFVKMDDTAPNSGAYFPGWTQDPRLQFQHLTVEMLSWQNTVNGLRIPTEHELKDAGYLYAWFFRPPIVNTPVMLQYFLDELADQGVDVNVETGETYNSLQQLQDDASDLGCDMVVNCTGMGSRTLVPDEKLVPGRGVLLKFERDQVIRRPEILENPHLPGGNTKDAVVTVEDGPWGSETHPAYMIPRGSNIVVGGTYLEGDFETQVRPEEREQLMKNAQRLGIDLTKTPIQGEMVGFRPFRSPVRCEFDTNADNKLSKHIPIFHSYGYGGSGWTVNVGAAKDCADQIMQH